MERASRRKKWLKYLNFTKKYCLPITPEGKISHWEWIVFLVKVAKVNPMGFNYGTKMSQKFGQTRPQRDHPAAQGAFKLYPPGCFFPLF